MWRSGTILKRKEIYINKISVFLLTFGLNVKMHFPVVIEDTITCEENSQISEKYVSFYLPPTTGSPPKVKK